MRKARTPAWEDIRKAEPSTTLFMIFFLAFFEMLRNLGLCAY
jgi:hypothetical protein